VHKGRYEIRYRTWVDEFPADPDRVGVVDMSIHNMEIRGDIGTGPGERVSASGLLQAKMQKTKEWQQPCFDEEEEGACGIGGCGTHPAGPPPADGDIEISTHKKVLMHAFLTPGVKQCVKDLVASGGELRINNYEVSLDIRVQMMGDSGNKKPVPGDYFDAMDRLLGHLEEFYRSVTKNDK